MERVIVYMLKAQKTPHIKFLKLHKNQINIFKRHTKTKFGLLNGCQERRNGLEKYAKSHLLHNSSIKSSMNEGLLQHMCILTWERCEGSHLTHCIKYVAPNSKTIFFSEQEIALINTC